MIKFVKKWMKRGYSWPHAVFVRFPIHLARVPVTKYIFFGLCFLALPFLAQLQITIPVVGTFLTPIAVKFSEMSMALVGSVIKGPLMFMGGGIMASIGFHTVRNRNPLFAFKSINPEMKMNLYMNRLHRLKKAQSQSTLNKDYYQQKILDTEYSIEKLRSKKPGIFGNLKDLAQDAISHTVEKAKEGMFEEKQISSVFEDVKRRGQAQKVETNTKLEL